MSDSYFSYNKTPNKEAVEGLTSPFVRTSETGDKVYYVVEGIYHWVKNPQTLEALGGSFGIVQSISYSDLRKMQSGDAIDVDQVPQYPKYVGQEKKEEKKEEVAPISQTENSGNATSETVQESINIAVKEAEKEFKVYPQKEETKVEQPSTHQSDTTSYILYVGGQNTNLSLLRNIVLAIKSFGDIPEEKEFILMINGSSLKHDNPLFTFADKVVLNPERRDIDEALNQAIRVAKGSQIIVINSFEIKE